MYCKSLTKAFYYEKFVLNPGILSNAIILIPGWFIQVKYPTPVYNLRCQGCLKQLVINASNATFLSCVSLMMNGAPGPCPSCHLWLMYCACLRPGFLHSVPPFPHPIFSLILLATVLITTSAANCFIIPPLSCTMCWKKSPLNPITFLLSPYLWLCHACFW